MKKRYKKPTTDVEQLHQQSHILQSSPVQGTFTDEEPEHGWDREGANSNTFNQNVWDEWED